MKQLVHERLLDLTDRRGTNYRRALVYAERQPAGTWAAWLEFVSATGEHVLQTDRETTQSTLEGVAYWATGLQPTYFEGALERAWRRTGDGRREAVLASPLTGGGMVALRVRTSDPEVAFRLMATRTLFPGLRRQVGDGGITYVRSVAPVLVDMPRIYEFLAHFRSQNSAVDIAHRLEEDLRDTEATLEIRRLEVPIDRIVILAALLEAAEGRPDPGRGD